MKVVSLKDKKKRAESSPYAIEVENVTVKYRAYNQRPATLKETLIRFAKTGKFREYSTLQALSGISFNVEPGKVLGIIGSNGAGKSTLLKVLSGVMMPSEGEVRVKGVLDSLIQLGAGFDPELNAVENIYLYASLHRQSRSETKDRVESILDFSELHEFAYTPIKYYSSGMYARLGFSVAIDRDPDVLLVDEVLAVGDERFQDKCMDKFNDFVGRGKTIVIVTHGTNSLVDFASEVILISKGSIAYRGTPKDAIAEYRNEGYRTAL